MRGIISLLLVTGAVIASACSTGVSCPCPAIRVGPGWCSSEVVEGDSQTCSCPTSSLCPGWCLPDGGTEPVMCADDAGAGRD
jgi:hypothetical protein